LLVTRSALADRFHCLLVPDKVLAVTSAFPLAMAPRAKVAP
jgi:hypothetical protein